MQTILLLVQRDYIKTTLKILCTKITTIVWLVDVNIMWVPKLGTVWVSKFKTRSKSMTLLIKKYDENCIERAQVNERLTEFRKKKFIMIHR